LSQGAVGIELRANDQRAREAVAPLNDKTTEIELMVERSFQAALDGSCRSPIAGLATLDGRELYFGGEVLAPDGSGSESISFTMVGVTLESAARNGTEAGEKLRERTEKWLVE
jgi:hydroxymethylbilane synthase